MTQPADPEIPSEPPETRRHEAVLELADHYDCGVLTSRVQYRLVATDGAETAISRTAVMCGGSGASTTNDVYVALPPTFLRARINQQIRFVATFPTTPADRRTQTVAFSFVVRAYSEVTPSRQPMATTIEPGRPGAPGWGQPLVAADEPAFVSESPDLLAATTQGPLRAHDRIRVRVTRRALVGIQEAPLVHIGTTSTPNDVGEGLIWQTGMRDGTFIPFTPGASGWFSSRTPLGLVPGERYDVRILGAPGARDEDGRFVPPTQDDLGSFLVAWAGTDFPVATARRGARLAFDVHPIRIESPRLDDVIGPDALSIVDGVPTLPVELLVRDGDPRVESATDYEIVVRARAADGSETPFFAGNAWPPGAADPAVISPMTNEPAYEQAGGSYGMRRVTIGVALPGDLSAFTSIIVEARLGDAPDGTTPEDVVDMPADFVGPAVPESRCEDVAPGSSTPCVRIVDTDERDCRIDQVCLDVDADAETVEIEVAGCGTATGVLGAPEPRPSELSAGPATWRCTGPVTASGGGGARREQGSDVHVTVRDTAGNAGLVTPDVQPPCFTPDRHVRGGHSPFFSHARDALGRPILLNAEGDRLALWSFDGTEWMRRELPSHAGDVYRGRIDSLAMPDGTVLFCATRRSNFLARADRSYLWDVYETNGSIDLVAVRADGSLVELTVGDAMGLGCGLALDPRSASVVVAYTAGAASALPSSRRGAPGIPTFLRCNVTATPTCSGLVQLADVDGSRPLGLDPDVAVDPSGTIHIVGRGLQSPDMPSGTVEEFTVYEVLAPYVGRRRLRTIVRQTRTPDVERDEPREAWWIGEYPSCDFRRSTVQEGALQPRVFAPTSQQSVVFVQRFVQQGAPMTLYPQTPCRYWTRLALDWVVTDGTSRNIGSVAPISEGQQMPPHGTFRRAVGDGSSLPVLHPRLRFPTYDDREPEVLPGYDVQVSDTIVGTRFHVAYQRRYVGDSTDFTNFGGAGMQPPSEDPGLSSSAWYDELFFQAGLARLTRLGAARHRIDVETGHARNSSRAVSLALTRTSPFLIEPSVAYDRWIVGSSEDLMFADGRVGQFVDSVRERARASLVPQSTCWSITDSRAQLSPEELNLVPDPALDSIGNGALSAFGAWASPRATTLQSIPFADYRDVTGAAVCAASEAVAPQPEMPLDDEAFATFNGEVRDEVLGRLLGIVNNLAPGPAIVSGTRIGADTVAGGTLTIDAAGEIWTATVAAAPLPMLVDALNESLTTTSARLHHPRVSIIDFGSDEEVRIAIAVPRSLTGPTASSSVLSSPLATALGLPVGRPFHPTRVDAANGDERDRMRPCSSTEPCSIDGGGPECDRPAECFAPASSLLDEALADVTLSLGRPPLRLTQEGVCVPVGSSMQVTGDTCGGTFDSVPGPAPTLSGCGADATLIFDSGGNPACQMCTSATGLSRADGTVRTCRTHADCGGNDCYGRARCLPELGDFFCTQRSIDIPGVPAGTGFCARARTDCAASDLIPLAAPRIEVGAPPPPLMVCRSILPIDGDDFEPASLECTSPACLACTGAGDDLSSVNEYCVEDSECPVRHRCVVPGRPGIDARKSWAPACMLRPFLSDDRFRAIDRYLSEGHADATNALANLLLPELRRARATIRRAVRDLGRVMPSRVYMTIDGGRGTGHSYYEQLGFGVGALDATIRNVELRPLPDADESASDFPGAGDLLLDVYLREDRNVRLEARVDGNVAIAGVVHGVASDMVIDVDVDAVRLRLRPVVRYPDGAPRLDFRVIGVDVLHRLGPNGENPEVLQERDMFIVSSTQQDSFLTVIRVLLIPGLENLFLEAGLQLLLDSEIDQLGGGDVAGLTAPLGELYQTVAEQPLIGSLIFGEEAISLIVNDSSTPGFGPGLYSGTLEGAALERGPDTGSVPSMLAPVPGLGLHYRGPRSSLDTQLLGMAGPSVVCDQLGLPSPNCSEGAPDCR